MKDDHALFEDDTRGNGHHDILALISASPVVTGNVREVPGCLGAQVLGVLRFLGSRVRFASSGSTA